MNEHPKQRTAPLVAEEFPAAFAAPEKCVACAARCTNDPPDCYASGGQNAAGASEGQAEPPFAMSLDDVVGMWNATKADSFEDQLMEFAVAAINFYKDTSPDPREMEIAALRERIAGMEKDARSVELKTIEDVLSMLAEPIGMECCGQPDFDHGHVCCGNGEPMYRNLDEANKELQMWRQRLINDITGEPK